MYNYLIIIEALSDKYQEEIKKVCELHDCKISKVVRKENRVNFEIITEDPVNFFRLGRRWLDFDNIVNVR